jgi:hypothetical protein
MRERRKETVRIGVKGCDQYFGEDEKAAQRSAKKRKSESEFR